MSARRFPAICEAIRAVHSAFGAPGDYGYDTPKGAALNRLYQLYNELTAPKVDNPDDAAPLVVRLADCLAAAVDTPLLELGDPDGFGRKVQLRLCSFDAEIAERAAELLEEAGQ